MITLNQWHTIRHLAALGKSERSIASTLNVSREAVSRAINQEEFENYHRDSDLFRALESYRPVVIDGLNRGLNGLRLYAHVRSLGFSPSRTTFYRWLKIVRSEESDSHTSCRYETVAGEQAQYDWSPYTVEIGEQRQKIIIYSLLLGFSRRMHLYPSMSETQESVLEGIAAGLDHIGGCCRYLLIDNAKAMVLKHQSHQLDWNPCFLAFCAHYRIMAIAATPHHPQTKGKVENPFRHLETNFLMGRSWRDWQHLNEQLLAYENARELRIHSTTRQTPLARFEEERGTLIPLPSRLFLGCPNNIRKVNNDGLISYRNNRYCVPVTHGLKFVRVYTRQGRELLICDDRGRELICHTLYTSPRAPILSPECYEGIKTRSRFVLATQKERLANRFQKEPIIPAFLELLVKLHPNKPENTLGRILELIDILPVSVALSLLAEAVSLNRADVTTLTQLLPRFLGKPELGVAPVPSTNVLLPELDVERSLDVYEALLSQSSDREDKETRE